MTEGLDPELGGWAGWSADNKWELERGWITTGATLDELAANIAASKWDDKMDAEKLKASVARWNELCDKGADEDFGRQQLAKVETGPFYAIPLYPGICNTIGGARRNENANIVDPSGNPIPRLYSAGLVRQHEWPHLRHHRRQWLRELVRRPYRRPQCRRPRTLGCRNRGLGPAWRR